MTFFLVKIEFFFFEGFKGFKSKLNDKITLLLDKRMAKDMSREGSEKKIN